jgi:hypothetical protein
LPLGVWIDIVIFVLIALMLLNAVRFVIREKSKGVLAFASLDHLCGIPGVQVGEKVTIKLYKDRITFNDTQVIPKTRLKQTNMYSETEVKIVEREKGVLKHAFLGGLIGGPVGEIVGAINGLGTEKVEVRKTVFYFEIKYVNLDGEETRGLFVIYWEALYVNVVKKFSAKANKVIGYSEQPKKKPTKKDVKPYEI